MITLDDLIIKVTDYNPNADVNLIRKAYEYAEIAHTGQFRYSKVPYIAHCLEVAWTLAEYKTDTVAIVAGLMHDIIEKGGVSREEVSTEFGPEIAFLIDSVSRIGYLDDTVPNELRVSENLRKMILAMSKDLRVVIIKIAEYLDNLRSIFAVPEPKRHKLANKVLDIFAPLADRLGMSEAKGELEDLAFPVIYPTEYESLKKLSLPYYKQVEDFLEKVTRDLHGELGQEGIRAHISSRPKHLYSLWKKMNRPEINHDIDKVYDLVAIRVLVDSVKECYVTLGTIHRLWHPVVTAGGVRDYIAHPKPNGYQSIHTNVFIQDRVVEIQVRTYQMHEEAENGVAAHWHYAETKTKDVSDKLLDKQGSFAPTEKLSWVKQLVAWQNEIVDSTEYLNAIKFDALAHRIFVFTPKGDVYDLPQNSTPLDLAYAVHTDLGHQANGAKISGKYCKLDCPLKNGDIVDIVKDEKTGPNQKWLSIAVTQKAKTEIRKYLDKNKTN